MPSASGGFVELAPPGLGILGGLRPRVEPTHGRTGCRLTVQSEAGTLSVVTAAPAPALVEAVCRFVLGALGDGSRA